MYSNMSMLKEGFNVIWGTSSNASSSVAYIEKRCQSAKKDVMYLNATGKPYLAIQFCMNVSATVTEEDQTYSK